MHSWISSIIVSIKKRKNKNSSSAFGKRRVSFNKNCCGLTYIHICTSWSTQEALTLCKTWETTKTPLPRKTSKQDKCFSHALDYRNSKNKFGIFILYITTIWWDELLHRAGESQREISSLRPRAARVNLRTWSHSTSPCHMTAMTFLSVIQRIQSSFVPIHIFNRYFVLT